MAASSLARRKRKRAGGGIVPVDSFADIAFLLIIFFIIATTLLKPQGFEAVLPSSQESDAATEEQKSVPTISLQGEDILWDTDRVTLPQLRSKLDELNLLKQEERLRIIRLQSAPSISMGLYYQVWAAIADRGGIVTIVKETE